MMKYLSPFRWGKAAPSNQDNENPVVSFQRALNSLFDDFPKGFDLSPFEEKAGFFSPSIYMTEYDRELRITAELPCIDERISRSTSPGRPLP